MHQSSLSYMYSHALSNQATCKQLKLKLLKLHKIYPYILETHKSVLKIWQTVKTHMKMKHFIRAVLAKMKMIFRD